MGPNVYIPKGTAESEFIEKRSRFICKAEGVLSAEEAKAAVLRRREEHSGCSHVVHAFILGPPKSRTMGMSDDGEPKGTAGRPVLEILKGSGITNICVTIVRYFGGTKLGTGGLVRAYSRTVKDTLSRLQKTAYEELTSFVLTLPYELFDSVKRSIRNYHGMINSEDFTTRVRITGEINKNMIELLQAEIRDLSKGTLNIIYKN